MKTILTAIRSNVVLHVLTGIFYPLLVTGIAMLIFPYQANGSLVTVNGKVVGSALIGQNFTAPTYFHGRPSATTDTDPKDPTKTIPAPYNALNSGGSNLGPTSADLQKAAKANADAFRKDNGLAPDAPVPADMVFASGSGLDPHISPEAARLQIDRVAKARKFSADQRTRLSELVERMVEKPQLGFLGDDRVNVLLLNVALDELK